MAALATLLLRLGKTVSGSDLVESATTAALRAAGATVEIGHRAQNVCGAQYVVRSSAIPGDNPEVLEAERLGVAGSKLAEAVGELMWGRVGVAVAGTHGKTTTTALLAWLLQCAGLEPMALIGAEALNFGASALAGSGPMVVEADEYDRRFLHLSPTVAIVTSVELDHLDYFGDLAEIRQVFQAFVDKLPRSGRLVVCADEPSVSALAAVADRQTYGFHAAADWRVADYMPREGGGARFTLRTGGRGWPVESSLLGRHNAANAAAALAAADYFGVGLRSALASLQTFRVTRRRFETRGQPSGVWVVDDYAHHPTAVAATLRAAREVRRQAAIWAVFQPHTTNRTAALLDGFARSFDQADHVLVLPIYRPSGREAAARPVSSGDLVDRMRALGHPDARLAEGFDDALAAIEAGVRPGDLVLTLGAGDVTTLCDRIVARLESCR